MPMSFPCKNTQLQEGPFTATRILLQHIFVMNMSLLVNAGNCDLAG